MALFAKIGENEFGVGDTVRVHQQIEEEGKKRTQIFEGFVIGIKGSDQGKSFMVRRVTLGGYGVERIFPLFSPTIVKVEVTKKATPGVRKAKLYYLRDKSKRGYDDILLSASRKNKKEVEGSKKPKKKSSSRAKEESKNN